MLLSVGFTWVISSYRKATAIVPAQAFHGAIGFAEALTACPCAQSCILHKQPGTCKTTCCICSPECVWLIAWSAPHSSCCTRSQSLSRLRSLLALQQHGRSPHHSPLLPTRPLLNHLQAYELRGAGAVMHSHSLNAVMATMLDPQSPEFKVTHLEMIKVRRKRHSKVQGAQCFMYPCT